MQRREFISLLSGVAVSWPLAARAQQPRYTWSVSCRGTTREVLSQRGCVSEGLNEVGFTEGRNLAIEYRFADDHYDHLPALAADLIEHRVALIAADPRGVYAAQKATQHSSDCLS